jgi:hypothetical protein
MDAWYLGHAGGTPRIFAHAMCAKAETGKYKATIAILYSTFDFGLSSPSAQLIRKKSMSNFNHRKLF